MIFNAKELRLELRDDGDGFKVKARHDGFGLAGMRERVEQMGGNLTISSRRGKGTKIAVTVPYNLESGTVKSKKKPDRKVKAAPKKPRIAVLIADDHSVVREGLVSLIRRKPDMLVVAEASNGREAVDLWKQHHPDVALLDLRMPELDGVSAIKEIRAGNEHARIIVTDNL